MADSTYEYLVKEYLLLGGQSEPYRHMYISAMEAIKKNLLFRGMDRHRQDLLFAGNIRFDTKSGEEIFEYQTEHLKCFLGGMVGLGSRAFGRPDDLSIAQKLVNGCIWAYDLMPTGIMPETLHISGCRKSDSCEWEEEKWFRDILGWPDGTELPTNLREATRLIIQNNGLQPPILEVADPKYRLRPEAIESIFILYRITGDKSLQSAAWRMFQNIEQYTKVKYGYAALKDTRDTRAAKLDAMESFWLAETLKYFYLIFSDPEIISLDEYVL
jgi:mannosyl-oligosaccharide alpha-1,2-mannosidase